MKRGLEEYYYLTHSRGDSSKKNYSYYYDFSQGYNFSFWVILA